MIFKIRAIIGLRNDMGYLNYSTVEDEFEITGTTYRSDLMRYFRTFCADNGVGAEVVRFEMGTYRPHSFGPGGLSSAVFRQEFVKEISDPMAMTCKLAAEQMVDTIQELSEYGIVSNVLAM